MSSSEFMQLLLGLAPLRVVLNMKERESGALSTSQAAEKINAFGN